MLNIPSSLRTQFETCLQKKGVPKNQQRYYYKWLRYYLDFCHKYHFPHEHRECLPHFLKKLQEKRQTQTQQEQAVHAIGLYYDLLASVPTPNPSQEGNMTDVAQEGKPTPDPSQEGKPTPDPSQEGKPTPDPSQEGKPTPDPSQEGSELSIDNCQLSIDNSRSGCGHLNTELTLTDRNVCVYNLRDGEKS